jgi:LysR family glycine cleavage system transcriptional activator
MRKLPPLNALKAFEAAARHISLTKAAQELHVTHGAVSRQVSLLEDWLGVTLLHRRASQVSLTGSGRTYALELTSLLDRLSVISAQVTEKAAPSVVNVSAPPTFTMRWLIPRLSIHQRRHPDVEVRLTTSIAPVRFHENDYDIAIRGALAPMTGCESIPFMTETIVPICHADLVDSGALRSPADLTRHTLIRYITEPCTWSTWFQTANMAEISGSSTLHFEQMYFALQAAAAGLGVVLVPLFLVADDIMAGKLCAPFGLHGAMQRHYYANTSPAAAHNGVITAFRAWLMEEGRSTEQAISQWAQESFK